MNVTRSFSLSSLSTTDAWEMPMDASCVSDFTISGNVRRFGRRIGRPLRNTSNSGTDGSHRDPMAPAMQIVHRLHGEEHHEVDLRRLLRIGQTKIQLAASVDDLAEQLIDCVLVTVREAGHGAADLLANLGHEARRRRILR